jgi:nicotinamidase-related amidase
VTGRARGRTDIGTPTFSIPADSTELVADLDQHPDDYPVSKQRWGAFIGTSLHDYLRQRGVTQIFLTGIASSSGVESTTRSGYDCGYDVVLVVDAMTDRDADAHRHSLEKIFPRLGQTETTDNVLKVLRG